MEATAAPRIAPGTTMGAVALTVADLDRTVRFWTESVGLQVLARDDGRASLGADGQELVSFTEQAGAAPDHRYTGLFHVALLVPSRPDLAAWLRHAAESRVPLTGASDHFVSEAIYLQDPDGHGIEVYADRPREHWEGQTHRLTTLPLDAESLLAEDPGGTWERLPDGTRVGHTHLQVRDVPEAIAFYRDALGFELMATYGNQAAFLAAGGYHHHIGANTWNSLGADPAPEGAARLLHATIVVPDADELERVRERVGDAAEERDDGLAMRDPSGITLLVTTA